jgi:hypothetical protein
MRFKEPAQADERGRQGGSRPRDPIAVFGSGPKGRDGRKGGARGYWKDCSIARVFSNGSGSAEREYAAQKKATEEKWPVYILVIQMGGVEPRSS